MNDKDILNVAISVIKTEADAVLNLINFIDDNFVQVVKKIAKSNGRVIITGIGKSANVAIKIVASLNSTGTPSVFMHAADAIHGDLGIVQKDDIVIFISKSGNTPEIKILLPWIKKLNNTIIAIVSDIDSYLARAADYILPATVTAEACPNNLVPTSSTTAQLVIGDALTIALLQYRNFTAEDFAKVHPGGTLGKKLYLRVEDIYINNEMPKVYQEDNIKQVISEITSKRLGAATVIDIDNNIIGIITDGDLRRMLDKYDKNTFSLKAKDIMSKNPKTISKDELATNALEIIKNNNITQLIVAENNKYLGMLHLHDIIKEGIF